MARVICACIINQLQKNMRCSTLLGSSLDVGVSLYRYKPSALTILQTGMWEMLSSCAIAQLLMRGFSASICNTAFSTASLLVGPTSCN